MQQHIGKPVRVVIVEAVFIVMAGHRRLNASGGAAGETQGGDGT